MTRKGQVTIPIEMRRDLGIEEGDKVLFVQCDGGFLHVTRSSDNSSPDISKLEHNSMNLKLGALENTQSLLFPMIKIEFVPKKTQ